MCCIRASSKQDQSGLSTSTSIEEPWRFDTVPVPVQVQVRTSYFLYTVTAPVPYTIKKKKIRIKIPLTQLYLNCMETG